MLSCLQFSNVLVVQGFRTGVSDEEATLIQQTAWDQGMRYWDTSPWYGRGLSEHRCGRFLYDRQPRDEFVLSTKVGRLLKRNGPSHKAKYYSEDEAPFPNQAPFHAKGAVMQGGMKHDHVHDYTYDGIMRSYEDSITRLGMNQIDLLVIHDCDLMHFKHPDQAMAHMNVLFTSGVRALEELKRHGEIKGYGAGVNHVGWMSRYMDMMELDFFLVAQCFSLLHHHQKPEMPATPWCDTALEGGVMAELERVKERGMGVIAATAFNSGILVTGTASSQVTCNYRAASQLEIDTVKSIEAICDKHEVPLPAAALQFSAKHPVVASVVTGFGAPAEVEQCWKWMYETKIPAEFWADLQAQGLIHADYPLDQ